MGRSRLGARPRRNTPGAHGPPVYGMLEVVPPGTLGHGDCAAGAVPEAASLRDAVRPGMARLLNRLEIARKGR